MDIESSLDNFHKMGLGFASEVVKTSLVDLESRKRKILLDQEKEARLKSRALWLLCGDENTPFSINLLIIGNSFTLSGK